MEKVLIHCGEAKGKHTAVLIAEKLDKVIDSLELAEGMFTAMTTDNAINMLNAVNKESKTIHLGLGCIDHLLQLVINRSIDKVEVVKSAVNKFKKLSTATHKSSLNIQRIKKACGDLEKSADGPKVSFAKIITPVETRWNSVLMMIRSILHLQLPLEAIKESPNAAKEYPKLVEAIPDPEDFEVLSKIVPVLSKFESISQTLSSDQHPSLPYVIPKIHFLHNHLFSIKVKRDSHEDKPLNDLVKVEIIYILKRYYYSTLIGYFIYFE